jgi:Flp pilus assembly CpaF family ATPase
MDDWNYRPTLFKTANARSIYKAKKGVIRVSAYIEDNIIKDILVTGDFFIYPENKFLKFEESLINTPTDENSVRRIVNKFLNENKLTLIGITAEDFVTAISQAVSSR